MMQESSADQVNANEPNTDDTLSSIHNDNSAANEHIDAVGTDTHVYLSPAEGNWDRDAVYNANAQHGHRLIFIWQRLWYSLGGVRL